MKKQQIPLRWPAKAGGGKVVGYLSLLYLLTYSPMKTTLHSDESSDIRWDPIELDSTQLILYDLTYQFSSVQSLSLVQLFVTPWMATFQASLSITNFWSSSKFVSIGSVMPSSHLILGHPLLLLPPIPPSIRVFSNESTLRMRWPKYWSFSFSIIPSKEHPGLISFRMDWLDLLAVQGTLKSLLQHHSSKTSILWCSAFFTVQLSHPYITTAKTISLTRQTFVSKVMSLLFNMLSRLVIAFLPRRKCLNFMAAVTICSDSQKQVSSRKTSISTLLTMPKPLTV